MSADFIKSLNSPKSICASPSLSAWRTSSATSSSETPALTRCMICSNSSSEMVPEESRSNSLNSCRSLSGLSTSRNASWLWLMAPVTSERRMWLPSPAGGGVAISEAPLPPQAAVVREEARTIESLHECLPGWTHVDSVNMNVNANRIRMYRQWRLGSCVGMNRWRQWLASLIVGSYGSAFVGVLVWLSRTSKAPGEVQRAAHWDPSHVFQDAGARHP